MMIGCDLDDCILETSSVILDYCNRYYSSNYKWEDIHTYSIEESFGWNEEVVDKCVRQSLNSSLEPISGAVNILNWLSEIYELNIISRRRQSLYNHTFDTLNRIGLKNFSLYLAHEEDCDWTKSDIANMLELDVFIEDAPHTIEDLYRNTKCDILVMSKPWNLRIAENDRIYIVQNWMEVRDWFVVRMFGG